MRAKKVGQGEVGGFQHGVLFTAALARCRKALVGTGLATSLLSDTNGHR